MSPTESCTVLDGCEFSIHFSNNWGQCNVSNKTVEKMTLKYTMNHECQSNIIVFHCKPTPVAHTNYRYSPWSLKYSLDATIPSWANSNSASPTTQLIY